MQLVPFNQPEVLLEMDQQVEMRELPQLQLPVRQHLVVLVV
jgi:hypothetical protein